MPAQLCAFSYASALPGTLRCHGVASTDALSLIPRDCTSSLNARQLFHTLGGTGQRSARARLMLHWNCSSTAWRKGSGKMTLATLLHMAWLDQPKCDASPQHISPSFLWGGEKKKTWPVQGCKYRQLGLEPALEAQKNEGLHLNCTIQYSRAKLLQNRFH